MDYTEYLAEQINTREENYIKNNIDEYNYLNESINFEDHMYGTEPKVALEIIDNLYEQNYLYLKKQPWADLLIKRIRKDIKKGFCILVKVKPSMFIKFLRMVRPVLSLFSKAHVFTQTLNDLDHFYETTIAGCYMPSTNKMYIVGKYNGKSKLNLDTFKVLLHEYCHYYADRKHSKYVELFKKMVLTFYTSLVENICETIQDKTYTDETKIKLITAIMDGAFNYRNDKKRLRQMLDRLYSIDSKFTRIYFQMMFARRDYHKDSELFNLAEVVLSKAYRAIGNEDIVNHIHKFNFSYQEFFCADEIVAIMSYYTPNKKPYLEMLRSL